MCKHTNKTMVTVTIDLDACLPAPLRGGKPDIDTFVAYQCNDCGDIIDCSYDCHILDLVEANFQAADLNAWDDALRGQVAKAEPKQAESRTMGFFGRAIRR